MKAKTLVAVFPLLLGTLLVGCEDDGDLEEGGPVLESIVENPEEHYGQSVTVTGEIHEVVGRYVVTISEEGVPVVMSDETSLRFFEAIGSPYLDATLRVQGEVLEFGSEEFESRLNIDLDGYEVYEGEPAIVATSVEPIQGESDEAESSRDQ